MPIVGESLPACARWFCEHLNGVLRQTITDMPLVVFTVGKNPTRAVVGFRQKGQPVEAPLSTKYGRMWLFLGQTCTTSVRDEDGRHQLHTLKYSYTLRRDDRTEALFRWEYDKYPGNLYCRHHLQGPIDVPVKHDVTGSLNDLHAPTGFVTIEEIVRFCIADLNTPSRAPTERETPPLEAGDHDLNPAKTWHEILAESYQLFKKDFAPRGAGAF